MNNQNFYLRLIALLLIIMAVFFYNGTVKDKEQAQDIADLTAKVESLENQQNEILTALQETYEEQKAAAESKASSDTSDSESDGTSEKDSADNKESSDQTDSEETSDDSDNVYKNGTFEGSGTGYGGTITVQVTLEDDTITAVSVVSAPGEDSAYQIGRASCRERV